MMKMPCWTSMFEVFFLKKVTHFLVSKWRNFVMRASKLFICTWHPFSVQPWWLSVSVQTTHGFSVLHTNRKCKISSLPVLHQGLWKEGRVTRHQCVTLWGYYTCAVKMVSQSWANCNARHRCFKRIFKIRGCKNNRLSFIIIDWQRLHILKYYTRCWLSVRAPLSSNISN